MICFPNIKINFGLHVINRRTDGFHTIETVFYPVKFCDALEVIRNESYAGGDKVVFSATGIPVAGESSDNLIVKAYTLLDKQFDLPPARVHLHKIIPMGAGLGGGSSDAAYMIRLLNDKFNLDLSADVMKEYAAELGSDCAFFVDNKPAYLLGKGHELQPINLDLSGYYFVLLYAGFHSNTALAYKNVNRREIHDPQNGLDKIVQSAPENWRSLMENDFELPVFEAFPLLAQIKTSLYEQGAVYAAMSGSGSAMYGLFTKKPQLTEKLRQYVCYEGLL